MKLTRLDGSNATVSKYVIELGDGALVEAVLYRYPDFQTRTVLCISVMCGCPVGCTFCGTGKHYVRNLTAFEITEQVQAVFEDVGILKTVNSDCAKLQIMFMSMGEPMLNWPEVESAISQLHHIFPSADLLISTVGIADRDVMHGITTCAEFNPKVGLQFSVHSLDDDNRNALVPYKRKLSLRELRDWGTDFRHRTGRPVFLNFCIPAGGDEHDGGKYTDRMLDLFSPLVFNLTFSVICPPDKTMQEASGELKAHIRHIVSCYTMMGYNTRMFDPAGQDDIGGGCGQLWHFQKWFSELKGTAC